MSDPLHARMSAAITAWLGDAIGDYARDLLATDMDTLLDALDQQGLTITDTPPLSQDVPQPLRGPLACPCEYRGEDTGQVLVDIEPDQNEGENISHTYKAQVSRPTVKAQR